MTTNNKVNNNFPSGLTATGTTNINSTGSGTTQIGSSAAGILAFASNDNSTVALNNAQFDLTTGTGTISICSNSTAQTINIGSSSTNSFTLNIGPLTVNSGTSSTNSTVTKSGSGGLFIRSGASGTSTLNCTGDFKFGNNSSSTWSIGASSIAEVITIGNTNSSSTMILDGGTGGIIIGNVIAKTTTVGNTTGATKINISTGTGGIAFPSFNTTANTLTTIPTGLYTLSNIAATLLTTALPTTISLGGIIRIIGNGSSGWKITQAAGQQINSTAASTTLGATGSIASSNRYDCLELVCTVANTTFTIVNSKGTLTFV